METKVESTPNETRQRRSLPSFLSPRYHQPPVRENLLPGINPPAPPLRLQRKLPKLKLREFDGNPLDWPEWSGMFLATVDSSDITRDEKMSHLKTLLIGKAKRALNGIGYSGAMYEKTWRILKRNYSSVWPYANSHICKIICKNVPYFVQFADIPHRAKSKQTRRYLFI